MCIRDRVEGDLTLAAEHEFGVYASTVKNNPEISDEDKKYIFEQLKANFEGECSEVGMYLCMARVAHREGYPEIGLYWEKACLLYTSFTHPCKACGEFFIYTVHFFLHIFSVKV